MTPTMMRKPRRSFPLFARILAWFFLNLLLLALAAVLFLQHQVRFGLESLLAGGADERLRAVVAVVHEELRAAPRSEWDAVLAKFGRAYPLKFYLFAPRGNEVAGERAELPAEVRARLTEQRMPPPLPPPPRGGQPFPPSPGGFEDFQGLGASGPAEEHDRQPPKLEGFIRAGTPPRYWIVAQPPLPPGAGTGPVNLVLAADSWNAGGLLFDLTPVLWVVAGVIGFSALFWLPLIRGLTRSLAAMNAATARIAQGDFVVKIPTRRSDELGELGRGIEAMAGRLAGLVQGQRRFLSDVAHELCAPLSRLQMALGILEERPVPATPAALGDVREEVDQIAALVNELLSFSRSDASVLPPALRAVALRPLLEQTIAHEHLEPAAVELQCGEKVAVQADPDLLQRALGNLLRNAAHYAAGGGPILLAAVVGATGTGVQLTVADRGPGVPAAAVAQLFDPFYRVDPSRTRATGGVGLGLTIARRCIEACRGTITARNREGGGLEIIIRLPLAEPGEPWPTSPSPPGTRCAILPTPFGNIAQ